MVISDLFGVLYFVFHCTYDDQVHRRNSGVRSGIERLTAVSYTHLDVYKRQVVTVLLIPVIIILSIL